MFEHVFVRKSILSWKHRQHTILVNVKVNIFYLSKYMLMILFSVLLMTLCVKNFLS